ncbi:MAG: GTP 3',8-cyclase MoaA [Acidimicrobiia bacterium]|nr:GTP 3',8-cyclase MoaA [Acidimicrobiia bacterium]
MELVDTFGRVHRDLRIAVTDRCNFRCQYCMTEEGMVWMPREGLLSFEEIERLASIMVERYGVDSIRLTGGEPTVRAHLPRLVKKLAALGVDLAMTTNGATLRLVADDLRAAGLKRVNISLDSLQSDRFIELTRRDDLTRVLDGIDAAIEAGFEPVKINAVLMRGINDDEIVDFARFGREKGVVVRFIEFMPLDADEMWGPERVVPLAEVIETINAEFPIEAVQRTSAPATTYRYLDGAGEVGVIATVTEKFCDTCDRIRLTADGQFRNCLFAVTDYNLRDALRAGASDDELAQILEGAVHDKWAGHGIDTVHFIRPKRNMSQIGG